MSLNNYTINKKQVKKIKQDLSYLHIFQPVKLRYFETLRIPNN